MLKMGNIDINTALNLIILQDIRNSIKSYFQVEECEEKQELYFRREEDDTRDDIFERIKKDIKLANTIIIFQEEMQKIMEYKNNFNTP